MIVRVLFEGQFEIGGAVLDDLNKVDNQIVEAVANNDESRFSKLMAEMHDIVVTKAKRVAPDFIGESDIILPAADSTMDEVRDLFSDDGMIPG